MSRIVTARPPRKRPKKPAQSVEIATPRIVQHAPKHRRAPKALEADAEADERVRAFFARMGLKVPDG